LADSFNGISNNNALPLRKARNHPDFSRQIQMGNNWKGIGNMTDLTLDDVDGTYLVLNARVIKNEASDFMLDAADRHKGGGPFRRALVHDESDGLTVNFGADYPGGVTISGPVNMPGPVNIPGPVKLAGVVELAPTLKRLVVHGDISYETHGFRLAGGGVTTITVVLQETLSALQGQITDLTTRVAALEARPH
jgi:hypothetical protein